MLDVQSNPAEEPVVPDDLKLREHLRGAYNDLRDLFENYEGGIPAEIIHGKMRYKVQKTWFALVSENLAYIEEEVFRKNMHIVPLAQLSTRILQFNKEYGGTDFFKRHTDIADIQRADALLVDALKACRTYFASIFSLQ